MGYGFSISRVVENEGDWVIFHLPKAYPPFMGILAYSASVIMDKDWAIANKCWDGNITNAVKFNNPAPGHELLQKITNGTNAFKMKAWEAANRKTGSSPCWS